MTATAKYAPGFLIAVPQLLDPNFFRAVVLLIEHSPEGAMGLTINHPTDQSLKTLYQQLGRPWLGGDAPCLMKGGPVQPEHAWILHGPECQSGSKHAVTPDVYLNTSLDALDELARNGWPFRFLVGYAGWGPGQLDREIQEGAWIFSDVEKDLLFRTSLESVWEQSLKNMGIDPAMLVVARGVH